MIEDFSGASPQGGSDAGATDWLAKRLAVAWWTAEGIIQGDPRAKSSAWFVTENVERCWEMLANTKRYTGDSRRFYRAMAQAFRLAFVPNDDVRAALTDVFTLADSMTDPFAAGVRCAVEEIATQLWDHAAADAIIEAASQLSWEVVEDRQYPGDWRVEAINHGGDGEVYVAIFSGPSARQRAEEYAELKRHSSAARVSAEHAEASEAPPPPRSARAGGRGMSGPFESTMPPPWTCDCGVCPCKRPTRNTDEKGWHDCEDCLAGRHLPSPARSPEGQA